MGTAILHFVCYEWHNLSWPILVDTTNTTMWTVASHEKRSSHYFKTRGRIFFI